MEFSKRAKNARKQAQTRYKALVTLYEQSTDETARADYLAHMRHYDKLISESRLFENGKYTGNSRATREEAVAKLEQYNRQNVTYRNRSKYDTMKANVAFAQQLNAASRGDRISTMTEIEARVFFRATQQAWEGKPVADRLNAILKYYKETSLEAVWKRVQEANADRINLMEKLNNGATPDDLNDEELALLQQLLAEDASNADKQYRKNDRNSPMQGQIASSVIQLEV